MFCPPQTVDYVNSIVDWEQLKPNVADSLVCDLIDSLEQDLAAEPKKEICPAISNEQTFRQAWYPFFRCPAVQMIPFQTRVFLGPSVSVPRQFMAIPQIRPRKPRSGEFLIFSCNILAGALYFKTTIRAFLITAD